MSLVRALRVLRAVRSLRRAVDEQQLRSARSPVDLAERALMPAARNLAVAIDLLPDGPRAEAMAAVLACRVLDAYEDLSADSALASIEVRAAARYLSGADDAAPAPPAVSPRRASEKVDFVLAERIRDIRELILQLPVVGQERVSRMLVDVGDAMSENLEHPMPRVTYGQRVLGRVVGYVTAVISEGEDDLDDLAQCVGAATQLANDLRDRELTLYGVGDGEELTRAIVLRLLTPALGSLALVSRLGARTPSRGARAALAHMTITTTAFFCRAVDVQTPYPRSLQLLGALWASTDEHRWGDMLDRVRTSIDCAVVHLLDPAPQLFSERQLSSERLLSERQVRSHAVDDRDELQVFPIMDARDGRTTMAALSVDSAFALVDGLPNELLTGTLDDTSIRRMMIADHLAFGSLEQIRPHDCSAMRSLGHEFQAAALFHPTTDLRVARGRQS